ncbi:helix-turn-helix domain-containing protein [Mycobacterium sp. OTB74]|uniref:helix-turn-helix domain-containing protein n=1 Tax=Mycobacterium sp. OTB74 TaxID=1853452 RepID=UPI0024768FD4|nr:helix-turn-helix domain-containing protein [Mycobacterium sp. OTB74]MDH6247643.1 uncharacterized protein (DUF2267 family) [Mycobacterium sp. OTB74]
MTELFVLETSVADEQASRLPADLPLSAPARVKLEQALHTAGYAVVSLNAVLNDEPSVHPPIDEVGRRRLRTAVAKVVNYADDAEAKRLEAAVVADPDDGLDENFWGPTPDPVAVSQAVFDDLSDQFAQRRQLAERSISRDEAAELLGVTAQSITSKLAAHKLVGMKLGREWRLPPWQFDPDHPAGVLPDLDALQAAFPGGAVSLSHWMMRAQPDFEGRTPLQEMMMHGSAPVINLARALTATAW